MATVTGFTAERMLEIENAAIMAGAVDLSGHLILTNKGGDTIDAGSVMGPSGPMQYFTVENSDTLELNLEGDGTVSEPWELSGESILPDRLTPTGQEVTNWDDVTEAGFYWGTGAANAPTPADYFTGIVEYDGAHARIIQTLRVASSTASRQREEYRRVYTTTWSAWTEIGLLPGRLAADLPTLGAGKDLDTVIETGWYIQHASANASLALNYPIAAAGHLEVSGSTEGSDFVRQEYTHFNTNQTWIRTYYNGTWTDWGTSPQSLLRLINTADASLSSTLHGFQVGLDSDLNLIADNNEIMARDNGAISTLSLNIDGGNVSVGNSASTVNLSGRLNSTHLPWAVAVGQGTFSIAAVNTTYSATVTFPAGRFTQTPMVICGANTSVPHAVFVSANAISSTGFTFNGRRSDTAANFTGYWIAIQMSSGSAPG